MTDVQKFISKGQTKEAISKLLNEKSIKQDMKDELILLLGHTQSLETEYLGGRIDSKDYLQGLNRVNKRLISIENDTTLKIVTPILNIWKRKIFLVTVFLFLLFYFIWVIVREVNKFPNISQVCVEDTVSSPKKVPTKKDSITKTRHSTSVKGSNFKLKQKDLNKPDTFTMKDNPPVIISVQKK
jgi:Na+-transporting methylmalonyl-CoA/oxaloacetate decarboxylase gamma subunit